VRATTKQAMEATGVTEASMGITKPDHIVNNDGKITNMSQGGMRIEQQTINYGKTKQGFDQQRGRARGRLWVVSIQ
jgi:hypothetical protein